jgi:hypothetical protein
MAQTWLDSLSNHTRRLMNESLDECIEELLSRFQANAHPKTAVITAFLKKLFTVYTGKIPNLYLNHAHLKYLQNIAKSRHLLHQGNIFPPLARPPLSASNLARRNRRTYDELFVPFLHETSYEVEVILGHNGPRRNRFYLIKWKYYDDSENSWEPRRNLDDGPLLQDYEKSLQAKAKQT